MKPDCPCCAPPWSMTGRDNPAWWLMKITDDGQRVVWSRDQSQDGEFNIASDDSCLYISDSRASPVCRILNLDSTERSNFLENGVGGNFHMFVTRGTSQRMYTYRDDGTSLGQYVTLREKDGTIVRSNHFSPPGVHFTVGMGINDTLYMALGDGTGGKLQSFSDTFGLNWEFDIGGGAGFPSPVRENGTQIVSGGVAGNEFDIRHIPPVATTRVFSMGGGLLWHDNHGNSVAAVGFCPNGNVIAAGAKAGGVRGGRDDGKTTRVYDSGGGLLWSADHGGSSTVWCVCSDDDSNVYAGADQAEGNVMTVRKYNDVGVEQWSFDFTLGVRTGGYRVNSIYWADGFVYMSGFRVVR